MKKLTLVLSLTILVFCLAGLAFSAPLTYNDYNDTDIWIETSGSIPNTWVWLNFPESLTGTYGGGSFEYDDYIGQVNSLALTLYGYGDNSTSPIDIYLDLDSDHSSYSPIIASYDVDPTALFTLTLDIKNNKLLYNGGYISALSGDIDPSDFVGVDGFWVGYACHFWHDKTEVDVSVNQVPEPSTMLLLFSGVLGLLRFKKKINRQSPRRSPGMMKGRARNSSAFFQRSFHSL